MCQLDALLAQAVNVGGGQALVAKTPHVSKSHVIHHNVEHIWTIADRGRWHYSVQEKIKNTTASVDYFHSHLVSLAFD